MTQYKSGLQVLQRIGGGFFGQVHLGRDDVHGTVAVKVLARKPGQSDADWATLKTGFLAEGQNLSKAKHRNVVQVHHIVEAEDGNSVCICMAYCSGGSLQASFERGPMSLAECHRVATDVLMGLSALHARGMLHRDIKPGNILLDSGAVAQISDFGLVTDKLVLGYGSQAGYSDHIAFEVWQGSGTSAKTDIWAFGMTLYRLLHGEAWYKESGAPRAIIRDGGFVDTLKWLPHIPKPWRRAIRKMLNDDPAARFQNTAQTLNAVSGLPTDPVWSVEVTPGLVRWERQTQTRRVVVEWIRHSDHKHEWSAWSEPLGQGRKKSLGGSEGVVSKAKARSGLETFFAS
ncbi:MAG TPA: serine/threonine-protein kinase [Hyphomicrobium sp.]|nr:serine/threonine-protein kinase [Hyphomicrobium sp.]